MSSAVTVSKLLAAVVGTSPLWLAVFFFLYGPENATPSFRKAKREITTMEDVNKASFWTSSDMKRNEIPKDVIENAKSVVVTDSTVTVEGAKVFYREAQGVENSHISLLLLHGMRFSSKTWLDLQTIHLLAAMGYRVVAVDLPGYGESASAKIPDKGEFLHALIQTLKLSCPVVVSPSMSGTFALPYILQHWQDMGGYIPVAPIGWEVLERFKDCKTHNPDALKNVPQPLKGFLKPPVPELDCIQVPTLVVYGENDRSRSSALLCLLPFSQAAEIPNGAHPAYLTDPDLWHKLLFNFLGYADLHAKQNN